MRSISDSYINLCDETQSSGSEGQCFAATTAHTDTLNNNAPITIKAVIIIVVVPEPNGIII